LRYKAGLFLTAILVIGLLQVACPSHCLSQYPSNSEEPLIISDIQIQNQTQGSRVIITANRYFEFFSFYLGKDNKTIAIDPVEKAYSELEEKIIPLQEGLVTRIKITESLEQMGEGGLYPVDMVTIELEKPVSYKEYQRVNRITVDIGQVKSVKLARPRQKLIQKPKPVQVPTLKLTPRRQPPTPKPMPTQEKKQVLTAKPKPVTPKPKLQEIEPVQLKLAKAKKVPSVGDEIFEKIREEIVSKATSLPKVDAPTQKGALSFKDCIDIATYSYLPLVIAEEEISLSDMKVDEAKRGLYPQATAKYTHTEGDVYGTTFIEKSYGLQLEQPLYYGGRLKLSLRQAEVNREVAIEKYTKAETEIIAKVTEKFYELAAAFLNLSDQKGLIDEVRSGLSSAKKRFDIGLSTQLELLNVQTQVNQVEYQLAIADKEVALTKIALLQTMELDPATDIQIAFDTEYEAKEIELNECLKLAFENRSEIHIQGLLLESSDFEDLIARSKDKFKVDLSGFLGESGGAYKTEDLDVNRDWYVGVKVTKPFGKSTGSYTFNDNETSPKLGQTTRTGSITHSTEVGIFDNLASLSEKQSAFIGKLKAENELIEMEKTINLEVREAFNSYEKAIMQLQNTSRKIRFREEEAKVLSAEAALNEALLSQVLESKIKLADEKALYHQAIASYKTALANLNKAIGIVDYFD